MKEKLECLKQDFPIDKVISQYPSVDCGDLAFCPLHQIAYQKDMSKSVKYSKDYFEKYVKYEGTELAKLINDARVGLAKKYCKKILDVGIGSGEFIKSWLLRDESHCEAYGYDINEHGVNWLKERKIFFDLEKEDPKDFDGVTLWDTLEHMKAPSDFLDMFPIGMHVFISIPIFNEFNEQDYDLEALKLNKHFRPNEHYYYFSQDSMKNFMNDCGYQVLEENKKEIEAGREGVYTFAFKKVRLGLKPKFKNWEEAGMQESGIKDVEQFRKLIFP
jgi:hypothetical protein